MQNIKSLPPVTFSKTVNFDGRTAKYIFISYCHDDKEKVYKDIKRLNKSNCSYWYDSGLSHESSEDWKELAKQHIQDKNCAGIIFYVSKNSFVSTAVYEELLLCKERLEDEDFTYKIVLLDGNNLFEIQKNSNIDPKNFSSERLINLYQMWGQEKLNVVHKQDGSHIDSIVDWFVFKKCINNIDYDKNSKSAIVRENYVILGDKLVTYFGKGEELEIEENDKHRIKIIGANSIASPTLKRIKFPNGVKVIEDFSIIACTNLESVFVPASVETMGQYGLSNFHFNEIVIDKNNKNYKKGNYGFIYTMHDGKPYSLYASPCKKEIDRLVIEKGTLIVNDFTISNCEHLKIIVFPKSIKRIGYWGVKDCQSLNSIVIYPDIQEISIHAFDSTKVKTIYLVGNEEDKNNFATKFQNNRLLKFAKIELIQENQISDLLKK
mgnify:CR=1 FL=1